MYSTGNHEQIQNSSVFRELSCIDSNIRQALLWRPKVKVPLRTLSYAGPGGLPGQSLTGSGPYGEYMGMEGLSGPDKRSELMCSVRVINNRLGRFLQMLLCVFAHCTKSASSTRTMSIPEEVQYICRCVVVVAGLVAVLAVLAAVCAKRDDL